MFPTKKSI